MPRGGLSRPKEVSTRRRPPGPASSGYTLHSSITQAQSEDPNKPSRPINDKLMNVESMSSYICPDNEQLRQEGQPAATTTACVDVTDDNGGTELSLSQASPKDLVHRPYDIIRSWPKGVFASNDESYDVTGSLDVDLRNGGRPLDEVQIEVGTASKDPKRALEEKEELGIRMALSVYEVGAHWVGNVASYIESEEARGRVYTRTADMSVRKELTGISRFIKLDRGTRLERLKKSIFRIWADRERTLAAFPELESTMRCATLRGLRSLAEVCNDPTIAAGFVRRAIEQRRLSGRVGVKTDPSIFPGDMTAARMSYMKGGQASSSSSMIEPVIDQASVAVATNENTNTEETETETEMPTDPTRQNARKHDHVDASTMIEEDVESTTISPAKPRTEEVRASDGRVSSTSSAPPSLLREKEKKGSTVFVEGVDDDDSINPDGDVEMRETSGTPLSRIPETRISDHGQPPLPSSSRSSPEAQPEVAHVEEAHFEEMVDDDGGNDHDNIDGDGDGDGQADDQREVEEDDGQADDQGEDDDDNDVPRRGRLDTNANSDDHHHHHQQRQRQRQNHQTHEPIEDSNNITTKKREIMLADGQKISTSDMPQPQISQTSSPTPRTNLNPKKRSSLTQGRQDISSCITDRVKKRRHDNAVYECEATLDEYNDWRSLPANRLHLGCDLECRVYKTGNRLRAKLQKRLSNLDRLSSINLEKMFASQLDRG